MTILPAHTARDRVEPNMLADDIGADTAAHPLTERVRAAFDHADLIDRARIVPDGDDDYYCLAY
ncbi:hypothetical protein [Nocardia arizonensis]|uniref:hypothetical protein n=1 Tax=Nocardia arizonensis TaxID=1141647 RepID=UPI0006D2A084|nr:hypothetical protein [Nocardia arizonensis]